MAFPEFRGINPLRGASLEMSSDSRGRAGFDYHRRWFTKPGMTFHLRSLAMKKLLMLALLTMGLSSAGCDDSAPPAGKTPPAGLDTVPVGSGKDPEESKGPEKREKQDEEKE
jgi:hypothetical protein